MFEVVLIRIPRGWKVIYRIDQRWVKNNRGPENTVYCFLQLYYDASADHTLLLRIWCIYESTQQAAIRRYPISTGFSFRRQGFLGYRFFQGFLAVTNSSRSKRTSSSVDSSAYQFCAMLLCNRVSRKGRYPKNNLIVSLSPC